MVLLNTVPLMMLQWGTLKKRGLVKKSPLMILVRPSMMHRENAKVKKEKIKLERMLEDHKKLLYPTTKEGQKKVGYHTGIAAMEGKEWCIRQGIWAVTRYPKEDASEEK
jgi:hypothetical protein